MKRVDSQNWYSPLWTTEVFRKDLHVLLGSGHMQKEEKKNSWRLIACCCVLGPSNSIGNDYKTPFSLFASVYWLMNHFNLIVSPKRKRRGVSSPFYDYHHKQRHRQQHLHYHTSTRNGISWRQGHGFEGKWFSSHLHLVPDFRSSISPWFQNTENVL